MSAKEVVSMDQMKLRSFDFIRAASDDEDEGAERVMAVISTETPARMPDFDRMEMVDEVLLSDGMKKPRGGKLPLIDSHDRSSISKVLGRVVSITTEGGEVRGELNFSKTSAGSEASQQVRDGYIDGLSVGYLVSKKTFIPEGKTKTIKGREFSGPVNVVTSWETKEASLVTVPADENARVQSRSEQELSLMSSTTPRGTDSAQDTEVSEMAKNDERQEEEARSVPKEVTPKAPEVDLEAVRLEAAEEERSRVSEIHRYARSTGISEERAQEFVSSGASLDQVRKELLEELSKRSAPIPNSPPPATGGENVMRRALRNVGGLALLRGTRGDQPHVMKAAEGLSAEDRQAFTDLSSRLGRPSTLIRHLIQASDDQRLAKESFSWGSREFADYVFDNKHLIGGSIRRGTVQRRSEGLGMVVAEFNNILLDAKHKEITGRQQGPENNWSAVANVDSLSDFREKHLMESAEPPRLRKRGEREQVEYENFRDASKETYALGKYRGAVSLSYEMLVNDDLGEFMNFVSEMAGWIPTQINESFWRLWKSNPALADGSNLFDATAGNYAESADYDMAADGVKALSKALAAWWVRTGKRGKDKETETRRLVAANPEILIVPPGLSIAARNLIQGATFPNQANPALPAQFSFLSLVIVPEFEHPDNGAKAKEWYLASNRGNNYARVGFLNGSQTPDVTTEPNNQTDAIDYFWRLSWAPKISKRRDVWKTKGEA